MLKEERESGEKVSFPITAPLISALILSAVVIAFAVSLAVFSLKKEEAKKTNPEKTAVGDYEWNSPPTLHLLKDGSFILSGGRSYKICLEGIKTENLGTITGRWRLSDKVLSLKPSVFLSKEEDSGLAAEIPEENQLMEFPEWKLEILFIKEKTVIKSSEDVLFIKE